MRIELAPDDDIVTIVRAAHGASLVVVVMPGRDLLAQALVEAAVAPLAIERAPGCRVNAVIVTVEADAAAVDAIVDFLESAGSTTGQLLTVS